jgi:hypothetical protein
LRLRRQTAGIEQVHRCMQADADLYRDEAIDKILLLVKANHPVTALNRCSTSRLGVPKLPTDLRTAIERLRHIYEHWDSYYDAQQRGRSPSRKYKTLLQELPGANPRRFIGTTRRDGPWLACCICDACVRGAIDRHGCVARA